MNSARAPEPADISTAGGQHFRIDGLLDFDTVPMLMKQARRLFAGADSVKVDFTGVTGCNSAGLALVLEMVREMKGLNKSIRFLNMPAQIRIFAEAYDVAEELKSAGILSK